MRFERLDQCGLGQERVDLPWQLLARDAPEQNRGVMRTVKVALHLRAHRATALVQGSQVTRDARLRAGTRRRDAAERGADLADRGADLRIVDHDLDNLFARAATLTRLPASSVFDGTEQLDRGSSLVSRIHLANYVLAVFEGRSGRAVTSDRESNCHIDQ